MPWSRDDWHLTPKALMVLGPPTSPLPDVPAPQFPDLGGRDWVLTLKGWWAAGPTESRKV